MLPKSNIDALSYYPRAILDSFWVRTETEAGRCCPYLFTAATSQLLSIVPSRLVDMADDPADNAVYYNCVPTYNHLDSEPNTFRNKFFPCARAQVTHFRKSYIKSRAETVSVLLRLIRFEPLPPLSVLLFMPRIYCRSLRVLHFCSKTNHTPSGRRGLGA